MHVFGLWDETPEAQGKFHRREFQRFIGTTESQNLGMASMADGSEHTTECIQMEYFSQILGSMVMKCFKGQKKKKNEMNERALR